MKAFILLLSLLWATAVLATASAQCSICTRTAAQMGERPAKGLNTGILYLALTPLAIAGVISYRWWRTNRHPVGETANEGGENAAPLA